MRARVRDMLCAFGLGRFCWFWAEGERWRERADELERESMEVRRRLELLGLQVEVRRGEDYG